MHHRNTARGLEGAASAPTRILIVEDDIFIALDLQDLARLQGQVEVVTACTIAQARQEAASPVALALLDIDVLDGKTFELAEQLQSSGTPVLFISGSNRYDLPPQLQSVPFIAKPYDPDVVTKMLVNLLRKR
ncbi:response regulator [Microvirga flavescens]|uniref:response regulator n=1 Tax=Microvirga flavescens TaxID=2249811 RepID=UPI0013008173|nr:response regulator [Microvirga flavescens]